MSMNKKTMVREIGRRTQLKNQDVQAVIETLMELWTGELASGGRIELEGFCTLKVRIFRAHASPYKTTAFLSATFALEPENNCKFD